MIELLRLLVVLALCGLTLGLFVLFGMWVRRQW